MIEPSEEFLASMLTQPWRPRSLRAPRKSSLAVHWRIAVLVVIVLLHVLGARWFLKMLVERNETNSSVVLVVNFVDVAPPAPPIVVEPPEPVPVKKQKRKPKATNAVTPVARPPARFARELSPLPEAPPVASPQQASAQPLQLYDAQGRIRVPDDMLEQIDKKFGDQRVFSYQIPRMDDAKKAFYRNQVLTYETTRFDQYWKPDQDMLTELLTKLVEKTTKEIKIPVPGHPGSKMVCQVSILALGGGCRVITNGADYVGPVDDPNTLNAEEERQCAAWWNQIIGAKTQDIWRQTRSLYEAQCRKPRERKP